MDIQISLEETGSKGRYTARIPGIEAVGEMTFSRISPTRIIVDHTGVPDALRGQGIAQALALHVVEEARAKGFAIVPLCPFLKAQADKHPEWSDVIEMAKA